MNEDENYTPQTPVVETPAPCDGEAWRTASDGTFECISQVVTQTPDVPLAVTGSDAIGGLALPIAVSIGAVVVGVSMIVARIREAARAAS